MTTDNATELRAGSLVLHKERGTVHVVKHVGARFGMPNVLSVSGFHSDRLAKDFTPIGHLDDGWTPHTTSECPVGADERVEVVLRNGTRWGRSTDNEQRADDIMWSDMDKLSVVAYRLAPNPTHQEAEAVASVEPTPSDPQPIDPRTLRFIVENMRDALTDGSVAVGTSCVRAWIGMLDKLLPREPEPLKPGDRVKSRLGLGTLRGTVDLDGVTQGCVVWDNCDFNTFQPLSELQPITPEKAGPLTSPSNAHKVTLA